MNAIAITNHCKHIHLQPRWSRWDSYSCKSLEYHGSFVHTCQCQIHTRLYLDCIYRMSNLLTFTRHSYCHSWIQYHWEYTRCCSYMCSYQLCCGNFVRTYQSLARTHQCLCPLVIIMWLQVNWYMQQTIAVTFVSSQGIACSTATVIGAWSIMAVLFTHVNAQYTLINICSTVIEWRWLGSIWKAFLLSQLKPSLLRV